MSNIQPSIKNVEKQDLEAVANFYNVPAPVAKMMFSVIGDTLYPKLQFLLYKGHQKGIQRIELTQPKEVNGEWVTEARIYPLIPHSLLMEIVHLPESERKAIWDHYSKPTIEWGRASKENVANQTMHKWLPEMSRKRAAARALRLYAGIGQTSFEEMPQAILTKDELEADEAQSKIVTVEPSIAEQPPDVNNQASRDISTCQCGHPDRLHLQDRQEWVCLVCAREHREEPHHID